LSEVAALWKAEDYGHKYCIHTIGERTKKPTNGALPVWKDLEEKKALKAAVDSVSHNIVGLEPCFFADEEYFYICLNATTKLPDAIIEFELFNPDATNDFECRLNEDVNKLNAWKD
jgi:hypothetical protein